MPALAPQVDHLSVGWSGSHPTRNQLQQAKAPVSRHQLHSGRSRSSGKPAPMVAEPDTETPEVAPPSAGEPGRGAAIAIAPDDSLALVVNRDVGSVSVLKLSYDKAALSQLELIKELPFGAGSEPYQVAFSPDGAART